MDLMVNPVITDFRQDVNGDIKMLKIGANKEDAYANIVEQGGGKVENNKTATIDVSAYTEPVEVTPSSGKTSMKKATITLSNIPSPSGTVVRLGYKDPSTVRVINTDISHQGIFILYNGGSMVPQFTFSYDSENDKITITGSPAYNGVYERDTEYDLYSLT